tara:strand:+ start:41820 stop:41954 length:135 start_codon:yes stop_codon:yes gene_type:complete
MSYDLKYFVDKEIAISTVFAGNPLKIGKKAKIRHFILLQYCVTS